MMTHLNCDKWTRYRIAPVTKFMEVLLHKVDEWMIFISIQILAWDNNYTDLSKKNLQWDLQILLQKSDQANTQCHVSDWTKNSASWPANARHKIQKALHNNLFVSQMWSHCMNTIWNQPIIRDSQSKYEYCSSVLIIYWVWMPFPQRCFLSRFRQWFLWNANECISTNSFKYTLKRIITI